MAGGGDATLHSEEGKESPCTELPGSHLAGPSSSLDAPTIPGAQGWPWDRPAQGVASAGPKPFSSSWPKVSSRPPPVLQGLQGQLTLTPEQTYPLVHPKAPIKAGIAYGFFSLHWNMRGTQTPLFTWV